MVCEWSISPWIFGLTCELPSMTLAGSEPRETTCHRLWGPLVKQNVAFCCSAFLCCYHLVSAPHRELRLCCKSRLEHTLRLFYFIYFFFLCICSNSKLGLQTSVNKSFELRQLFLEANYCVLVNEPGRRNVKYIRLAATSLLSKGIILTSP